MAEYYLISQLPSLDGLGENMPVPITQERFLELCERFSGKKVQREIKELTLMPPKDLKETGSALIDAWNAGERSLRLALAKVRADKMNKQFDLQSEILPVELLKVAADAVEAKSPLEAENFLLNYRLSFLETLRPVDTFSEEYLYYYGLKLKLILRIRAFDSQLGERAYKNIYNSILNGDIVEGK